VKIFIDSFGRNHYRFDEIINEKIMKEAENYSSQNKKTVL